MNEETLPKIDEIKIFTQKAVKVLYDLKFEAKKAIVRSIIDKVVGTRDELQVYGYIPVNINVFTKDRHSMNTTRHTIWPESDKLVPFYFKIKLPPPLQRGVDYGFRKL